MKNQQFILYVGFPEDPRIKEQKLYDWQTDFRKIDDPIVDILAPLSLKTRMKLKSKPYTKREYVYFETDDAVHYRIQREFIDTERSLLHNIPDNTCFHQLYLTDGTLYCARNIRSEVIICE